MIVKNNPLLVGVHGQLGKTFVVKQYKNRIVIANYPDMSGIKRSRSQKRENSKFKSAVSYAKTVLKDPVKKAAFAKKLKPGQLVYHAAIKEYLESKK